MSKQRQERGAGELEKWSESAGSSASGWRDRREHSRTGLLSFISCGLSSVDERIQTDYGNEGKRMTSFYAVKRYYSFSLPAVLKGLQHVVS